MKRATFILLCILFVSFTLSCSKKSEESTTLGVNTVIGEVKISSLNGERPAAPGDVIAESDTVVTGHASMVDIVYGTSGIIRINENSMVRMTSLFAGEGAGKSRMDISKGKMFVTVSKLGKGASFEVASPTTIAAVRGTSFRVTADKNSSRIDVLAGRIKVNPVREGRIIEEIETVVETNGTVALDTKAVEKIVEDKKPIEVAVLKDEEITAIREEIKDIKPIEKLDKSVGQEIQQVIIAPPVDTGVENQKAEELKKQALDESAKADREKRDRLAAARAEKERLAREQAEKERLERERIAKEKQDTKEKRVKNIPNL
ncbi:MAG TPA: FecR domain-containing protein [Spirochaetota bacterium]|nr:FecR domain-containing protein [Spirochaetota bacterium]